MKKIKNYIIKILLKLILIISNENYTEIQKLLFFYNRKSKEISIDYIIKSICGYYGIKKEMLLNKTKKREIVQARQIAMHYAKIYTNASLTKIGLKIGGKDHATVLHACKTVKNLSETDIFFKSEVDKIGKHINNFN